MSNSTKRQTSGLPMSLQEQLANEASSISARIAAPSGDRIRMVNNSHFALPDGTDTEVVEGVIVDFVSANLYFEGAYDRENPTPPGCFAVGPEPTALLPTKNSPNVQADTCASCPQNQFGSSGKGKACKNTRLIAIQNLDDPDSVVVLSVPPTSIKEFDKYVQTLAAKHRMPPVGVLTRITLDKSESFAAPRFEISRPLQEKELQAAMDSRKTARERLSAEPDFSQYKPPVPAAGRGRAAARR